MKDRKDFVWIKTKDGIGSISHVSGRIHMHCVAGRPVEVTRAEWESRLCRIKGLELCEAPKQIIEEGAAQNE